ncbi:MAG: helix-turn-helix domain-containing protein [Cyanobacteria bacterium P01_D01_bin.14]
MAPRKLSDADKRAAIERYRQAGETTSTVAEQYGVSNSTISRLLKTMLSEQEYAELRSQKRATTAAEKKPAKAAKVTTAADKSSAIESAAPSDPAATDEPGETEAPKLKSKKPTRRRSRRRSSAPDADQLSLMDAADEALTADDDSAKVQDGAPERIEATATNPVSRRDTELISADDFDEDLDEDDLDEDLDDELDELDDDDLDGDEDGDEDGGDLGTQLGASVQIVPLTDTALPVTCYLVIDRLSELITRPLKEFAELAAIPSDEQSARTLPVFDNHRIARRFSRRNQRVIKVPNGQLLTKTRPYLQAKGIHHLLIDGTIYSLTGAPVD